MCCCSFMTRILPAKTTMPATVTQQSTVASRKMPATPAAKPDPSLPEASAAVKSKRKLPILEAIRPNNVQEEKSKFFSRKYQYDPQFTYTCHPTQTTMRQYGLASSRYLDQAIRIIEIGLLRFKSYSNWEKNSGGDIMTDAQVYNHIKDYLNTEGMSSEIDINITPHLLSYASMTRVRGRPTINIKVGKTHVNWIDGLLNHEIGTHYIRAYNNRKQPWKSKKKRRKLDLLPLNPTEEGLASLSTQILREEPTMWRSALMYYTIYLASQMSFSEVFNRLEKYVDCPEARWTYLIRAKRGQKDTSLPGCFPKDQIYLTGSLQILKRRHVIDFHRLFRLGKVSYRDIEKLNDKAAWSGTRLPGFVRDQKAYKERLDFIIKYNGLRDIDLDDC